MNRTKKMTIALAGGVGLVAVVALAGAFGLPWGSGRSGWSHVPPSGLFVTAQPKQEDVAGVYQLIQQTIKADGLAVLAGRPCELDLRTDGSFTVTNYPRWSTAAAPGATPVAEFISTTGRWRCDRLGIIYDGHECWGVVFSDTQAELHSLALRRKGAPYELMFTFGDGDEGKVMTFGKKK